MNNQSIDNRLTEGKESIFTKYMIELPRLFWTLEELLLLEKHTYLIRYSNLQQTSGCNEGKTCFNHLYLTMNLVDPGSPCLPALPRSCRRYTWIYITIKELRKCQIKNTSLK